MYKSQIARRSLLIITILIAWGALELKLVDDINKSALGHGSAFEGIFVFLSYFTTWTNILAVTALSLSLLLSPESESSRFISAVTTYMIILPGMYTYLLLTAWGTPSGWSLISNTLMHYVTPPLVVIYWIMFVPKGSLRWSEPVWWLAYPFAYLIGTISIGKLYAHKYQHEYPYYPYPFIDLNKIDCTQLIMYSLGLCVLFLTVGLILVFLDRVISQSKIALKNEGIARNIQQI
jgi:hypothetical protein